MKKSLFFFLLLPLCIFSDPLPKTMMFDRYFNPESGANDIIMLRRYLDRRPKLDNKKGMSAFSKRLLADVFLFLPLNSYLTTWQHELFGHGWRVRTFGNKTAEVVQYRVNLPDPYGKGGGFTRITFDPDRFTISQALAFTAGGVEAESILAHVLKLDWLAHGVIPPREASLYFESQQSITMYIQSLEFNNRSPGHDIDSYIRLLNTSYPSGELRESQLQTQALVGYLDPMTWYALWAQFHYLFSGELTSTPVLNWGGYEFLPNLRLGLSPFCPEFYLENYMKAFGDWMYMYARYGSHGDNQTYGIGFDRLLVHKWGKNKLYLRGDFWLQPAFDKRPISDFDSVDSKWDKLIEPSFTSLSDTPSSKNRGGMSLCVTYSRKMKRGIWKFKLGVKTSGFVQGQLLKGTLIGQESFAVQF